MKNKLFYIVLLFAVVPLAFSACYDDQGNYDYHDINEVSITGFDAQYERLIGETLSITPQITSTLADNEDQYKFEWIAMRQGFDKVETRGVDTLAQTRNLTEYKVNLVIGNYTVFYRVIDPGTGVKFETSFELTVKTSIYEGFLVMNDVDGMMRLDMLSYRNNNFYNMKDVLGMVDCELPAQQGPKKVVFFPDNSMSPGNYALYLLTESGANRIHAETFHYDERYNIKYHFLSPSYYPDDFLAENMQWAYAASAVLYSKGNLYNYEPIAPYLWGMRANTEDEGMTYFKASPHYSVSYNSVVVFNEDTKSFALLSGYACRPVVSLQNLNKELLYINRFTSELEPSAYRHYAIMKDAADKTYWMSMNTRGVVVDPLSEITAPSIESAEHFAIGGEFSKYIFYNAGGKIYAYDTGTGNSKMIIDKGASTITFLGFQQFFDISKPFYVTLGKKLIVGSYNPAAKEGTLEMYTVPGLLTNDFTVYNSWGDFGKIVSIDYRAR